jgi:WD40 repeat protein
LLIFFLIPLYYLFHLGGGFTSNRGLFGILSKVENVLCITFGKNADTCYTGIGNGSVYIWINQKLARVVKEAHQGPIFSILALENGSGFITGGKDGMVILWDDQFNNKPLKKYSINKNSFGKSARGILSQDKPSIKAISLGFTKIIVGTLNGEIIEIDKDVGMSILTQGHSEGELWGLACHPSKQEFCTASDDKTLRIWDLDTNTMKDIKTFTRLARSCEYSPDGKLIAVGMKDGAVVVMKSDTFEELKVIVNRNSEISDVKFSPSK